MKKISLESSGRSPARFDPAASRPGVRLAWLLLAALVLWPIAGCSKQKSTEELLNDLKSREDRDKINAVRLLPGHSGDAATVVPALIKSLKDKDGDVRRSAALGLGNFGPAAREAVPALQALQKDHDARVRESAALALSRIEPDKFPPPSKGRPKSK
jgi:hypothetical protein